MRGNINAAHAKTRTVSTRPSPMPWARAVDLAHTAFDAYCLRYGVSSGELARHAGVGRTTVYKMRYGREVSDEVWSLVVRSLGEMTGRVLAVAEFRDDER